MSHYDIDAARAQRAEAAGQPLEPWIFNVGAAVYAWPPELPAGALELIGELKSITDDVSPEAAAAMSKLLRMLSGEHAEEVLAVLSIQDLVEMLPVYIERATGSGLGESQGSPASSPPTPRPRKRTSRRTTG